MRIVAFTGPKFSGKNTAARILLEDEQTGHYFFHTPMAEGVKNICYDFFGWTHNQMEDGEFKETPLAGWSFDNPEVELEPRWAMMDIANWLRNKYGGGVHVRRWLRWAQEREEHAKRHPICHVMTDLRFPDEHQMLLEQNALIIYIARPSAEAALQEKKALGDQMALNPSEAFYDMIKAHPKTLIIPNAKEPYHLWNEVRTAVKNKYGHPVHWANTPQITDPINLTGKE